MTVSAKVYTTKSNAVRAAKAASVDPATVYATEGGFTFPAPFPAAALAAQASGNPAGWETAGGPTDQEPAAPASDSGTPLSDLVDEPPVVLRAKRAPAKAAKPAKGGKPGRKPKAPAEPKAPRDTKLSRFVAMLQRPEGCTLDDAMEAFGWQRHTARGAIAGAIKVKLGHTVETEKVEGKTVYRIPA